MKPSKCTYLIVNSLVLIGSILIMALFGIALSGCGNAGSGVVNTIVVPNTTINGSGSISTNSSSSCTKIDVYEILDDSCAYGAVLFQSYVDKSCKGTDLGQFLGSQMICKGRPIIVASPSPLPSPTPTSSTAASTVSAVTFCPTVTGGDGFPETGMYIDGELYAVFAQGQNIHFTKLVPGSYVTTDGRNCQFTVKPDNSIVYN